MVVFKVDEINLKHVLIDLNINFFCSFQWVYKFKQKDAYIGNREVVKKIHQK